MTEQNKPATLDDANCQPQGILQQCPDKQPPAEAGEGAVKNYVALIVEQLDDNKAIIQWLFNPVPEGEQLCWQEQPGLYTSQTTATQAAVAAAMGKCAEMWQSTELLAPYVGSVEAEYVREGWEAGIEAYKNLILASILAEANAALDAYVAKACFTVADEIMCHEPPISTDDIRAIVTSVIEKKPGA